MKNTLKTVVEQNKSVLAERKLESEEGLFILHVTLPWFCKQPNEIESMHLFID